MWHGFLYYTIGSMFLKRILDWLSARIGGRVGHRGVAAHRGFVHVLLMIFVILGISMWGISEILFRANQEVIEAEAAKSGGLHEARQALIDYALIAPPRQHTEVRAGHYEAFVDNGAAVPYRVFSLPCPDTVQEDGDLNSVSDIINSAGRVAYCDVKNTTATYGTLSVATQLSGIYPLQSNSRVGRLPWRGLFGQIDGDYAYVRGVGNRVIGADNANSRFWYGVSRNLVARDSSFPHNPHWLLRQQDDWIVLAENNVDGGQVIERVAAVVVSPNLGASGALPDGVALSPRVSEDEAARFDTTTNDYRNLAYSYLDFGDRLTLAAGNCVSGFDNAFISLARFGTPPCAVPQATARLSAIIGASDQVIFYGQEVDSDNRMAHIVIDDLIANGADDLMGDEGGGYVADLLSGTGNFLGIQQLMRAHFDRYGYLPSPAAFSRQAALSRERRSGVPLSRVTTALATLDLQIGTVGTVGIRTSDAERLTTGMHTVYVEAWLPMRNVRRAYVDRGSRLLANSVNQYGDGLPPYNLPLYSMDTSLNRFPMELTLRQDLMSVGVYPHDNLFGISFLDEDDPLVTDSFALRGIGNAQVPLNSRVYVKQFPRPGDIDFVSSQRIVESSEAVLVLSEPALAYIRQTVGTLSDEVSFGAGADEQAIDVDDSLAFGVQVKLPAGTRFRPRFTEDADEVVVSLFLPDNVIIRNAEIEADGSWRVTRNGPVPFPARFEYGGNELATLDVEYALVTTAIYAQSPVQVGDVGFLPTGSAAATVFPAGSTLRLLPAEDVPSDIRLAAGVPYVTPGNIRLPHDNAYSRLPVAITLYNGGPSTLHIAPFPPPGRPYVFDDNTGVDARLSLGLPSPIFIAPEEQFILPVGTQVYYPANSQLTIGLNFSFPEGTRAFIPAGSMINLPRALADQDIIVFPGGQPSYGTAVAGQEVELVHGALVILEGARVILREGIGVGATQEIFDIELQSFHRIEGSTVVLHGGVLQPLTGRALVDSIAPIDLEDATISLHSWTRLQFLTHARNVLLKDNISSVPVVVTTNFDVEGEIIELPAGVTLSPGDIVSVVPGISLTLSIIVTLTTNAELLAYNEELGDGASGYTLREVYPDGAHAAGVAEEFLVDDLALSEQSGILLAPGEYTNLFNKSAVATGAEVINIVASITLGTGTRIFSPHFNGELERADGTSLNIDSGIRPFNTHRTLGAETVLPLAHMIRGSSAGDERGIVQNQLVMIPDTDIVVNNTLIVPAHSVVDMLQARAWPPGSTRTLPRVAADLQAVSDTPIYLYFPSAVTLTNRVDYGIRDELLSDNRFLRLIEVPAEPVSLVIAASAGTDNLYNEIAVSSVVESLVLPEGSYVIVPPGEVFDYLSYSTHSASVVLPEVADYAMLPRGAVVMVPDGGAGVLADGQPVFDLTVGLDSIRPQMLRIGDNTSVGGLALLAHADYMSESPIVYYPGDTYLSDIERPVDLSFPIAVRILAGGRGDIFGNISERDSTSFDVDLLPADTAELLRNFPMVYAVAPGCRDVAGRDLDCADNGRGLEFSVGGGEDVVLEEDLVASGRMLIAFVRDERNLESARSNYRVWESYEDYYRVDNTPNLSSGNFTRIGINSSGHVMVSDGVNTTTYTSSVLELPELGADNIDSYRVYLNLTARITEYMGTIALTLAELEEAHYVDLPALTLFAGGYTEFIEETSPAHRMTIIANDANGDGVTNLQIGPGAEIFGNESTFPFGRGGLYRPNNETFSGTNNEVRVPLDNYRPVGLHSALAVESRSRYADVDFAGNVLAAVNSGEFVTAVGDNADIIAILAGGVDFEVAQSELPITLMNNESIVLSPGYLWQGYFDTRGGEIAVTLSVWQDPFLPNFGANASAYLRVHPKDDQLNFFGSGVERAEGLDSRGLGRRFSGIVNDISLTLRSDGSIDPDDDHELTTPNPNDGIVSSDVFLTERHAEFAPFRDPEDIWRGRYGGGNKNDSANAYVGYADLIFYWRTTPSEPQRQSEYPIPIVLRGGAERTNFGVLGPTNFGDQGNDAENDGVFNFDSYVRFTRDLWPDGWRARVDPLRMTTIMTVAGTPPVTTTMVITTTVTAQDILVNIRDADTGRIISGAQTAKWTPWSAAYGRDDDDASLNNDVLEYEGWLTFGSGNSAPFLVRDQSYISNQNEVWAHRQMVRDSGRLASEDRAEIVASVMGQEVTVVLNAPAFQLRGRNLAWPRLAEEYNMKEANVRAEYDVVAGCLNGPVNVSVHRVPSILGHYGDVERIGHVASGGNCAEVNRGPSFSSRVRRNANTTPYSTRDSVAVTRGVTTARRQIYEDGNPKPITARIYQVTSIVRVPSRVSVASLFEPEVSHVIDNDATAFNPGLGTVGTDTNVSPATYVVPAPYVAETGDQVALVNRPTTPKMRATFGRANAPDEVPVLSDMFFYIDTAYHTDATGVAASRQLAPVTLRLGNNFQINGPSALVPHFGGRNRDSVADLYAARSRMFYSLFSQEEGTSAGGTGPRNKIPGDNIGADDEHFLLHKIYSAGGYQCPSEGSNPATVNESCAELNRPGNVPYWVPIVSGIAAFEEARISFGGDIEQLSVALVVPEPAVVTRRDDGTQVSLVAGSIIYPHTRVVRMATKIPETHLLLLPQGALAAVDVSPVNVPTPVKFVRRNLKMRAGDFNYAPQRTRIVDGSVTTNLIVEPIGFDREEIIDFSDFRVNDYHYLTRFPNRFNTPAKIRNTDDREGNRVPRACGNVNNCRYRDYLDGVFFANPGGRTTLALSVDISETVRYDGTFTRGFLMSENMANIMARYFAGRQVFRRNLGFETYFPRSSYYTHRDDLNLRSTFLDFDHEYSPRDSDAGYNAVRGNEAAAIGNPFSWHWLSRNPNDTFIPMGAARQFVSYLPIAATAPFFLSASDSNIPRSVVHELDGVGQNDDASRLGFGCGYFDAPGDDNHDGNDGINPDIDLTDFPDEPGNHTENVGVEGAAGLGRARNPVFYPSPPNPSEFYANLPCAGRNAHYWVGVRYGFPSVAPDPQEAQANNGDEFLALRLPHLINIPPDSVVTINVQDASAGNYPLNVNSFFQFPSGSTAHILQVDASSWESVHPYVSRYLAGAIFANDGGFYDADVTDSLGDYSDNVRNILRTAEQMRLPEINDGERQVDIGGRRLLHYTRSENTPDDYTRANVETHTNAWLRLNKGGFLYNPRTEELIELPVNTIVNPVLGTYLAGDGRVAAQRLQSNYQAYARTPRDLEVARPALIIPRGATVRVGAKGGRITNVKAAAIFSLRPLQSADCGVVGDHTDLDGVLRSATNNTVVIDQLQEGINGVTASYPGDSFTLANPCAWLEDSENTDGDRFYVYRSRRRHVEPYKSRILSNDRTYLLGGELTLFSGNES